MIMDSDSIGLLLIFISIAVVASNSNPTQLTDGVSINCGSSGTSAARDGKEWRGDVQSKPSSLLQMKGSSTSSSVMDKLISVDDPVPHKTAPLSFPILLCISSEPSNFSASITASALGVRSLVKEYCINVDGNQGLILVFTPESSRQLRTYAFVNGIGIISVPARLSYLQGGDIGVQVVGKSLVYVDFLFDVDNSTALEMIHRKNVRKRYVLLDGDIHDLFGMWDRVPNREGNKNYNSTWKISVDVGFRYLVRLYFSRESKIADVGGAMFDVRINDVIVNTDIDTTRERMNENGMALYRDYIVIIKGRKHQGKRDLLIYLNSNAEVADGQGPLKGFEIMKLSNLENSLASPNPLPTVKTWSIIVYIFPRIGVKSTVKVEIMPSTRAQKLCRQFSLAEIRRATKHFSDEHLIGQGGFGKVYKGLIDDKGKTVAIKQLKPYSKQGPCEFLNEIEILTKHRHENLVSLVGYFNENGEMMLVYEFLDCRAVADHLYKRLSNNDSPFNKICIASVQASLTWKQRLNICIGAEDSLKAFVGIAERCLDGETKKRPTMSQVVLQLEFALEQQENSECLASNISILKQDTLAELRGYCVDGGRAENGICTDWLWLTS
ncbi:hypothetical protein C2S51_036083 [Perilla frutescens var. frutescens]|nr:hypothetical protein C2S51_036083 [Perilla frutescens var. frutescens]